MKRLLTCCAIIAFLSGYASAADDPLQQGLELYKKHRYEEAVSILRASLSSIAPDKKSSAYLSLGMNSVYNAELYRELYGISTTVHLDYLKKLSTARGKAKSNLVDLYLGEALLEAGRLGDAISYYKKFIENQAVNGKLKDIAKVNLGLCYHLRGDADRAKNLWSELQTTEPEALSELASAYSRLSSSPNNPVEMIEKAVALTKSNSAMPMRVIKNAIGVYARAGLTDKAFNLLKRADMNAFSYEEIIGKNKAIRFYDVALLNNLSILYTKAGMQYLKEAASDKNLLEAANFYLGRTFARSDNIDESIRVTESFLSSSRTPRQFKDLGKVRLAAAFYAKGKKNDAVRMWNETIEKQNTPEVFAEILFSCSELKIECAEFIIKASSLAEKGEGRKYSVVNFSLGRHYLWKKNYIKALAHLETGRDKSNKNRVEYNNPMLLTSLAEAYYRTKKFSEALEIFFEMNKHFPAVRQIQVALQGIYSMEQKSSGDVKIF